MASPKRTRQRHARLVNEATATATEVRTDAVNLGESAVRADGTIAVKLIGPGWGSSGYYGADVLEAAGTDRVFPAGTQMFVDHPGVTERQDRPERSVRDLAAVLETDAVWRASAAEGPGLYAQARVFESWRPVVDEIAAYIGVSIRAAAQMGTGEAEGRRGSIIERLVEAVSVDFVTRAGRGGQVLAVLESHRPMSIEAGLYTDDLRDRLRTALMDRFGEGPDRWCYVRDFNDETVVFELYGDAVEDPGTFQLAYRLNDDQVVLADGAPTEVKVTTTYTPVTSPTLTNESEENQMDDKQITEAVAEAVKTALPDAIAEALAKANEPGTNADEAATELTEAKERADRAEGALLVEAARRHVAGNDKVKGLPAVARDRVVAQLANEAKPGTDGKLDTVKLDEVIATAVDAEVKYLAEATGSPVRGAGDGGGDIRPTAEAVEAAQAKATSAFKRLGMTDESAMAAVAGRS